MKAGMLNPFLKALPAYCQEMTGVSFRYHDASVLKLRDANSSDQGWRIEVPVHGQLNGKVVYTLDHQSALSLASQVMLDLPVRELDDMAMNALLELVNRTAARAAESLKLTGYECKVDRPRLVANGPLPTEEANLGIRLVLENPEGLKITTDLCLKEVPAHRLPEDGRTLH